jgi:hypothetical protein
LALPYVSPPLTYNELNGKHWAVVKRARDGVKDAGFYLSQVRHPVVPAYQYAGLVDLDLASPTRARLPRPIPGPIVVELVFWPGNNTVHDADNMAPTLKYLVDGLKLAGVLTDDRGRYVRSSICTVIERDDDPADRVDARMVLVVREL